MEYTILIVFIAILFLLDEYFFYRIDEVRFAEIDSLLILERIKCGDCDDDIKHILENYPYDTAVEIIKDRHQKWLSQ